MTRTPSAPTGLPSTPAGLRLVSAATTLHGSVGAGSPLPLRAVAVSPPTSITSWSKTRAEPTAKRTCGPIAMLATRHGRAATKAAWPEGRAVQTETLFGFLMATTIGPADSSCCRIAGQPCLAFPSNRYSQRIPRFFGCSSKSGVDPETTRATTPSLGKLGRATMDLGKRRVLMGEVSTGVVNHRRVASWLRGAARGSTAVLVTGAILLSFGCGARPKAEPAKVPLAPQSYTDGLLQQLPVPPGTRPWASHFYPGGFWPLLVPARPAGLGGRLLHPALRQSEEPSSHRRLRHRPRAAGRLRSQARTARRSQRGYQWFRVLGRYAAGQRLYSDSRVQRYPLWPWRGPPPRGRQSVVGGKAPAGGDHGGGLCRTAHRIHQPVPRARRPRAGHRSAETGRRQAAGRSGQLPPPEPDFLCFEDVLLYSISLHPPGHASPGYVLQAYSCGYDLFVSVDGVPLPPLWSGGCRFVRLLLALVPERAVGTRTWATGCARAPMTVVTNPS